MSGNLKASKMKVLDSKLKQQIAKVDKKELAMGKKVEMEHGTVSPHTNIMNDNKNKAIKIAMAHLKEVPDYYTRLRKMEAEGKK